MADRTRRISLVPAPALGPQFKDEAAMVLRDFYQQIQEGQPTDEEDVSYEIAILLEDIEDPQIADLLRQTDARNFDDFRTAFSHFYSGVQSLGFNPSLFFGEDTVSIEDGKEDAEEEDYEGGSLDRKALQARYEELSREVARQVGVPQNFETAMEALRAFLTEMRESYGWTPFMTGYVPPTGTPASTISYAPSASGSLDDRRPIGYTYAASTAPSSISSGVFSGEGRTAMGKTLMDLAHSMRMEAKMSGEGLASSKLKKIEPVVTENPLMTEGAIKEREAKKIRQGMRDLIKSEIKTTTDTSDRVKLLELYRKFQSTKAIPRAGPPSPTGPPSPRGMMRAERFSMSEKGSVRNVGKGKKRGGRAVSQQQIPRQIQQDIRYILNFLQQYPDGHSPLIPVGQSTLQDIRIVLMNSGQVRSIPINSILREIDDMDLPTIGAIRTEFINAVSRQGYLPRE